MNIILHLMENHTASFVLSELQRLCVYIQQMESKLFSENTYSGVVAMTPTASGDGPVSMEMSLSSAVARDS